MNLGTYREATAAIAEAAKLFRTAEASGDAALAAAERVWLELRHEALPPLPGEAPAPESNVHLISEWNDAGQDPSHGYDIPPVAIATPGMPLDFAAIPTPGSVEWEPGDDNAAPCPVAVGRIDPSTLHTNAIRGD